MFQFPQSLSRLPIATFKVAYSQQGGSGCTLATLPRPSLPLRLPSAPFSACDVWESRPSERQKSAERRQMGGRGEGCGGGGILEQREAPPGYKDVFFFPGDKRGNAGDRASPVLQEAEEEAKRKRRRFYRSLAGSSVGAASRKWRRVRAPGRASKGGRSNSPRVTSKGALAPG